MEGMGVRAAAAETHANCPGGVYVVVYDNAPGSDDINASNQTALGGGSIVIHK